MTETVSSPKPTKKRVNNPWLVIAVFLLLTMLVQQLYSVSLIFKPRYTWLPGNSALAGAQLKNSKSLATTPSQKTDIDVSKLSEAVNPSQGVTLPIKWGDIGSKMIQNGVIDLDKFKEVFGGTLTPEQEQMLTSNWDKPVVMNRENSRFILDALWAFGLANKNPILDDGEMQKNGKVGNYASTGGWRLSSGSAMDHYSKYNLITLTDAQQKMVDDMSKGIYRPCCGNSTHFPDCNHGMAMLGLIELMAANNVNQSQAWDTALKVNSLWFEDTYVKLATYFQENGKSWDQVDPKIVLSSAYSSGRGFANIKKQIKSLPPQQSSGGGCGV